LGEYDGGSRTDETEVRTTEKGRKRGPQTDKCMTALVAQFALSVGSRIWQGDIHKQLGHLTALLALD